MEIDIRDTKEEKQRDVAYLVVLMAYGQTEKWWIWPGKLKTDIYSGMLRQEMELVALFVGRTFQKVKRAAPGEKGMLWIILVRWP